MGQSNKPELINGSILALSTLIPAVVASAAEAEYAALFHVGQETANLRNILADLDDAMSEKDKVDHGTPI